MYQTSKKKIYYITVTLIVLAMAAIMAIDYKQMYDQKRNYEEDQAVQAEKAAITSLTTIDKASSLLEQETSKKMEEASQQIQEKYEENPHFKTWDFEKLKRTYGMDIYIIDKDSTIIYSSVNEEVGMNFAECCGTLNEILEERRKTGQLYIDDIDIQQKTGEITTFSYMATKDKKYMIELGYSLEDEEVFEAFNFLNTMKDIEDSYPTVMKMNVFNFGAIPFGQTEEKVDKNRKTAVRQARDTFEITEMEGQFNQEPAVYRYIPYIPSQNNEEQVKVIEMIYSKTPVFFFLTQDKIMLFLKMLIIITLSIALPKVFIKLFIKPNDALFYNEQTNLKTSLALVHQLKEQLHSHPEDVSLLLFEVNKVQNPQLKQKLLAEWQSEFGVGSMYDLGRGEYGCMIVGTSEKEAETRIHSILEKVDGIRNEVYIGAASATNEDTAKTLYKKTDAALALAKQSNRGNLHFFADKKHFTNHG